MEKFTMELDDGTVISGELTREEADEILRFMEETLELDINFKA